MRPLTVFGLILLVIGALNWGLIGLFGFNVVEAIFGKGLLTSAIYILVGAAGVYGVFVLARLCQSSDDVCVPGHYPASMRPD